MNAWIVVSVSVVVGVLFGFLGTVMLFLVMLAQNGLAMKDGKIKPITPYSQPMVINFPSEMTEERAEEMIIEFAARIRGEPAGMTVEMFDERVAAMVERAMREI